MGIKAVRALVARWQEANTLGHCVVRGDVANIVEALAESDVPVDLDHSSILGDSTIEQQRERLADMDLRDLGLNVMPYHSIIGAGITTVGGLIQMRAEELRLLRQVGVKSLANIRDRLQVFGLKLKGD